MGNIFVKSCPLLRVQVGSSVRVLYRIFRLFIISMIFKISNKNFQKMHLSNLSFKILGNFFEKSPFKWKRARDPLRILKFGAPRIWVGGQKLLVVVLRLSFLLVHQKCTGFFSARKKYFQFFGKILTGSRFFPKKFDVNHYQFEGHDILQRILWSFDSRFFGKNLAEIMISPYIYAPWIFKI